MENKPQQNDDKKLQFAFGRTNYILMAAGLIILALGYILLSGGSDDPTVFNDAMFDARRLYVAPILIVVGFIVEIIAILFKSKKQ